MNTTRQTRTWPYDLVKGIILVDSPRPDALSPAGYERSNPAAARPALWHRDRAGHAAGHRRQRHDALRSHAVGGNRGCVCRRGQARHDHRRRRRQLVAAGDLARRHPTSCGPRPAMRQAPPSVHRLCSTWSSEQQAALAVTTDQAATDTDQEAGAESQAGSDTSTETAANASTGDAADAAAVSGTEVTAEATGLKRDQVAAPQQPAPRRPQAAHPGRQRLRPLR